MQSGGEDKNFKHQKTETAEKTGTNQRTRIQSQDEIRIKKQPETKQYRRFGRSSPTPKQYQANLEHHQDKKHT